MADRVVKVGLILQASQFMAEAEKVRLKTAQVGTEAEKLAAKRQGFDVLGRSMVVAGAAVAAGLGLAVSKFADFDKQMSAVQAATHESAATMGLLRSAAIEAGASTVFTATESAQAIEEMSKAGIQAKDILGGGLSGALNLASAGAIGVGRAAEIAATALTQFKLEGSDVPHVADLFAAAAGKAQGGVEEMSQAFSQAGLVASQTGLSIEETTGTLAAFASAGLIGSDAGTSFRTMLLRLTPQSKEAAKEMERLNFSAFDTNGEFIGMEKLAGEVAKSFGGMNTQARNASAGLIFGQDAIRAFNVLLDQGSTGISSWIDNVNDSGYAAETARIRLDNLSGDVEKLGGAFDTALIKSGSGANDTLREIVQSATFLVDAVGNLPQPVMNAGMVVGALAAGVGLVGGAALIAVPKIIAFKGALGSLGISAKSAATSIGLVGGAITAATLVIGGLVQRSAEQAGMVDQLADSYDAASGAATKYTREIVKEKLASVGAYEVAKKAGISQKELTDAVMKGGDALERMHVKLGEQNDFVGIFNGTSLAAYTAATGVRDLGVALEDSKQKHKDIAAAEDASTVSAEALTAATEAATEAQQKYAEEVGKSDADFIDLGSAFDAAKQKARDLATATGESAGVVGDALTALADSAQVSTADYIAELQKQVDAQNGWEANMLLLAARVPQAMIDELRQIGPKGAEQVQLLTTMTDEELGKTVELWKQRGSEATGAYTATLTDPRTVAVIQAAGAQLGQGAADEIAHKLAAGTSTVEQIVREYGLTVESVNPVVHVDTSTAEGKLASLKASFAGLSSSTAQAAEYNRRIINGEKPYWSGGYTGAGGKYEAAGVVHKGEFVFPQEITRRYRRFFEYLMNGGSVPGYAAGGYVRGMDTQYAVPSFSSSVSVSPQLSLAGVQIAMDIGGQQIIGVIRDQAIAVVNDREQINKMTARGGVIR